MLDAGRRARAAGDVVACPRGRAGAHQVLNDGDEPARVLIVSTMDFPEVAEHLDSHKVLVVSDSPARAPDVMAVFRAGDAVDLWEGET